MSFSCNSLSSVLHNIFFFSKLTFPRARSVVEGFICRKACNKCTCNFIHEGGYGIELFLNLFQLHIKGGFFSESEIRFSDLQISKKIPKTILSLKFKFPAWFFGIFFLRFGDLKNESNFLKKAIFSSFKYAYKMCIFYQLGLIPTK